MYTDRNQPTWYQIQHGRLEQFTPPPVMYTHRNQPTWVYNQPGRFELQFAHLVKYTHRSKPRYPPLLGSRWKRIDVTIYINVILLIKEKIAIFNRKKCKAFFLKCIFSNGQFAKLYFHIYPFRTWIGIWENSFLSSCLLRCCLRITLCG